MKIFYCIKNSNLNLLKMSQKIILYWGSGSVPCWRLQLALEEKHIQYENKFLSFDKKEHKSDEIMKLNPRGQVILTRDHSCFMIQKCFFTL